MTDILDALDDLDDDFLDGEVELYDGTSLDLTEVGELTEDRAREVTNAIRSAATATFVLLAYAHQNKAHKALGYATWADYVKEEFDMSAQRSYQLLDLGKVISELEEVTPEGTIIKLTEAQARDIKRELPQITEHIREVTEGLEPDEASSKVEEIIDSAREEKAKNEEEREQRERQEILEAEADDLLNDATLISPDSSDSLTDHADDDYLEVTVDGDGSSSLSPEDSMNLYNFFNVLSGIVALPEPDDFISVIPKARVREINEHLLEATSWLNRFQTLWEIEGPGAQDDGDEEEDE